ncbi:uncharacterized protein LOC130625836 [Hydractinia symbiolongicarpus]|uniref:uncharacterized protein LOC130625836 n=1 Tax=Hydractinia symbiolongicarpus TaxID=13093 RepID=UPI00254DD013|nr:uncharacterized protein LOC130625836 [Hydractinia symbiolongicarpus]
MSILYIIILILSCLPLVYSLEIERRKYGDRLTNGSICDEGTYVMKQNVAPTLYCESRMNGAGCDWKFDDSNSHHIGFVPKETFRSLSLKVKLLKMAYFPDGNCSNHSIGRIDAQNIDISDVSVWDSKIGENINTSLIYQFNYTSKFLKVTFNKHWGGMLIKLFINCLNETGENIGKYAETRCVMIKYEGNITYQIAILKATTSSPPPPTSTTATTEARKTTVRAGTTPARKTVAGTTTAETTNARIRTSRATKVNRTNTTHMTCVNIIYKSSTQRENALNGVICTLGGLILIQFLVIYVGIKRSLLVITINWKNKDNQASTQGDIYDDIASPTSVNFQLSKPDQESQNYTELSLSQKDVIQANYASLCKDNQSYDGYETTSRYK